MRITHEIKCAYRRRTWRIRTDLLAGAGGLVTDEAQSDHQGRKALLLVRNNEDCDEFIALAKTMGINIVDRVDQRGSDAKWSWPGQTSGCD